MSRNIIQNKKIIPKETLAYSINHDPNEKSTIHYIDKNSKEDLHKEENNGLRSSFPSCASFASCPSSGRSTPLQFHLELDISNNYIQDLTEIKIKNGLRTDQQNNQQNNQNE